MRGLRGVVFDIDKRCRRPTPGHRPSRGFWRIARACLLDRRCRFDHRWQGLRRGRPVVVGIDIANRAGKVLVGVDDFLALINQLVVIQGAWGCGSNRWCRQQCEG